MEEPGSLWTTYPEVGPSSFFFCVPLFVGFFFLLQFHQSLLLFLLQLCVFMVAFLLHAVLFSHAIANASLHCLFRFVFRFFYVNLIVSDGSSISERNSTIKVRIFGLYETLICTWHASSAVSLRVIVLVNANFVFFVFLHNTTFLLGNILIFMHGIQTKGGHVVLSNWPNLRRYSKNSYVN